MISNIFWDTVGFFKQFISFIGTILVILSMKLDKTRIKRHFNAARKNYEFYKKMTPGSEERINFCKNNFPRSEITKDAVQWLFDQWDKDKEPSDSDVQDYLLNVHPQKMTKFVIHQYLEGIEEHYPIFKRIMDNPDSHCTAVLHSIASNKAKRDVMMWIFGRWDKDKKVSLGDISDYAFNHHEMKVHKDQFQEYLTSAQGYYKKFKLIKESAPDTSNFMNLMLLNKSIYNETGVDLFEEYRHSGSKLTRKGEPKKRDLLLNPYKNRMIINAIKNFIGKHEVWENFGEKPAEIDEKYEELIKISEKLDKEILSILDIFQNSGPTLFELARIMPISIRTLRKYYREKMTDQEYRDRFPSIGVYGSKYHELISLICSKIFMNEFGDQPLYFSEVKPYPKWANFMIDGVIKIPEQLENHQIFRNIRNLFPKIPNLKYVNIDYTMDISDRNLIDKILKYQFPKDKDSGLLIISTNISKKLKKFSKHIEKQSINPESISIISFIDFIEILNQNGENLNLLNFLKNQPTLSALKEKKQELSSDEIPIYGTSKLKSIHEGNLQVFFSSFKENIFEILNENRNPDHKYSIDIFGKLNKIAGNEQLKLSELKKKVGFNFYNHKYLIKALESKGLITIEGYGKNKTIRINNKKKVQKFMDSFF